MSPLRTDRVRHVLVSGFAWLLLVATPVRGDVIVFADPDNNMTDDGEVELPNESGQLLPLYIQIDDGVGGSGTPCRQGSAGDAICGYHVFLTLEGDGTVEGFVPGPGVESWPDAAAIAAGGVQQVSMAFTDAASSTGASLMKIGDLTVDASGTEGVIVLVEGHQVVTAGLQSRTVPSRSLAATQLPEPGLLVGLAFGCALLWVLARWRIP